MAWTFTPLASDIRFLVSAKLGTNTVANSGHLNDNDIGKPVKLTAANTYALCASGDEIEGWLVGVDPETVDGYSFGTVQVGGRVYAQLEGASTFGYLVEAGTIANARTIEPSGYGQVASSAIYGVGIDTVAELLPFVIKPMWRIISGAVTDDAIVLLERV